MASKYDDYWRSKLEEIKELIKEVLQTGHSSRIDISDIQGYGDRENWKTWVTIPPIVKKITEDFSRDAHGKSLGNVIIQSGILENVEKTLLGEISPEGERLFLHFKTCKKIIKHPPPRPVQDLSINRKSVETTIHIKEGATGFSYKNLFYPYLKDAKYIKLIDPYIRLDYQIRNFIAFCGILASDKGLVEIHLTTQSENELQKEEQIRKFDEMQKNMLANRIKFTYEFNDVIHDRVIESDNGWRLKSGRGLDIFQKPETWYGLDEFDQTKRKCKETEIDYIRY